jgi:diguanylate cyclase (GGDEF)-like protein
MSTSQVSDAPPDVVAPTFSSVACDRLRDAWCERCRSDVELVERPPPIAREMVCAVSAALGRVQPPGRGVDEQLRAVAERFARDVGSPDVALAQLACMRETFEHALLRRNGIGGAVPSRLVLAGLVQRLMMVVTHEAVAALQADALRDSLTGVGNRRAFDLALAKERARAERHQRFFSVAMIDLDGLKVVNDTQGHAAGDARLDGVAKHLVAACRRIDAPYRIGGDEFVVLMPETDSAGANAFVARLGRTTIPAFSAGTATFPADGFELLRVADSRLYAGRARRDSSEPVAVPASCRRRSGNARAEAEPREARQRANE